MSVSLDPIVLRKLQSFQRRRRLLLVARGVCAGVVTGLIAFGIVSLIDWYWLLSDQVRWWLSGAAYATLIVAIWVTCLRLIAYRTNLEEIATQMEMTDPDLRENLLSAVELAVDDPSAIHDSPVFRALLQGKVAQKMGSIRVSQLLPVGMVSRWLVGAVVLVAAVTALLFWGGERWQRLATRAVLPGANVARVSRIQVSILEPTPHSFLMAQDETVAIRVEVSGGNVNEVTLETHSRVDGVVQQPMRLTDAGTYLANIHVREENVDYRILAGDAVTQKYQIEAKSRPRVVAFQKEFQFPEYSQLPSQQVTETDGDLQQLEGTTVNLVLELDQPVDQAELHLNFEDTEDVKTVVLRPQPDSGSQTMSTRWETNLTLEKPAIYRVHLVASETGFENKFSPRYEIQPLPDLIPKVGFVDLQETTLLLPPNDILNLKGMAEDDLPLPDLQQEFSINGQEWESLALTSTPQSSGDEFQITAAWAWDLLNHQLKTGDQVLTRLVATDLKGNRGESIPLRVIIAAQEFDPQRHDIMSQKAALQNNLTELAETTEQHKTTALEVIDRLKKSAPTSPEFSLDAETLLDLAAKQRDQADAIFTTALELTRAMPAGPDAYELELTGSILARIAKDHGWSINAGVEKLSSPIATSDEKARTKLLDEIKRTFDRSADDAKQLSSTYRYFLSHNFLAAVAWDLDALLRQQQLIVDSPTQSWDRLLRQETVVVNQLRDLEGLIRRHQAFLHSSLDGHMNSLFRWSEQQRQRLQDNMESEEQLDQLRRTSESFLRELANKQHYDNIHGSLPGGLVNGRRDIENRRGSLHVPIEQLARNVQQEDRLLLQAGESDDSQESQKLQEEANWFHADTQIAFRHHLEQLIRRRELTQARTDSDAVYASDLGLTTRAVNAQLSLRAALKDGSTLATDLPPIDKHLQEIASAYRILEAGHDLANVSQVLTDLIRAERWNSQTVRGRIDNPRMWDVVNHGLEHSSRRLREAGLDREIVAALDETRWSAASRDANRKLSERRWRRETMVSSVHDLTVIQSDLGQVSEQLQPIMEEARATISKYAPNVSEMARELATQLRQFEQKTTNAADQLEAEEQSTKESPLQELNNDQQEINEKLDQLISALVEDANSQDILDRDQLERARDADDSIAMIHDPARKMNQELQDAQNAESSQQQSRMLSQAAEQQERTAQALERVAEHFQRLDEGLDVAETRDALRDAERELGLERQLDQNFQAADRMTEMSERSASDLLAELNAELEKNPAMQKALSEIAKNTLEEARNALDYAANDEQNLQRANERSDSEFQKKKREVAEDLRKLGAKASQLSRTYIEQAKQAAARGKSPISEQRLRETQEALNEVAAAASRANDDQLLKDLAQTAEQAQEKIESAMRQLQNVKQQTAIDQAKEIHPDEKSRDSQKRSSERQRQQLHEQLKRTARDQAKREEDERKRDEKQLRSIQEQVKTAQRKLDQSRKELNQKPDDAGLKNRVSQEESRLKNYESQAADASRKLERSESDANKARQDSDDIQRKSFPDLNAANPSAQLADQLTQEAQKLAADLKQSAQKLAKETQFGQELKPTAGQLAAAAEQQQEVTQDVKLTVEDIARAARHERRLQNLANAEPLEKAAEQIRQVANQEIQSAEKQLQKAQQEAETGESPQSGNSQPTAPRTEGLASQSALATAESAIQAQAEQLNNAMANSQTGDQMAEGAPGPPEQSSPAGQQAQTPQNGSQNSAQSNEGNPSGSPSSQSGTSNAEFTPEELARGQQLARTLDELDRQLAMQAENSSAVAASEASQQVSQLDSLTQAARNQQAQSAASRIRSQQNQSLASTNESTESTGVPPASGAESEFEMKFVDRSQNPNWGKLRTKAAEDLTKGRTESVSEEYRKSVETYFKVLAERARKK